MLSSSSNKWIKERESSFRLGVFSFFIYILNWKGYWRLTVAYWNKTSGCNGSWILSPWLTSAGTVFPVQVFFCLATCQETQVLTCFCCRSACSAHLWQASGFVPVLASNAAAVDVPRHSMWHVPMPQAWSLRLGNLGSRSTLPVLSIQPNATRYEEDDYSQRKVTYRISILKTLLFHIIKKFKPLRMTAKGCE